MSASAQHTLGLLTLVHPSPLTLLQDLGRNGVQASGFCQSGALDEHAFLWANALVSNSARSAALEITLGPFTCTFSQACRIAITGAATTVTINGEVTKPWQALHINPGDTLHLTAPQHGLRTYLAIRGGIQCTTMFGSAAMCPREKSGPFGGSPLTKGATIEYISEEKNTAPLRAAPPPFIPDYAQDLVTLRVMPWQDRAAQSGLWKNDFYVHQDANRMAYTFDGEPLLAAGTATQLSFPVPMGAIQLPPNGKPIVLMKDRQTIGGYPVLGCVAQQDTWRLAQMRPGQKLRFAPSTIEDCQKDLRQIYNFFGV